MNAAGLLTHEAWLEQNFRATETLRSHCDDVAIRQFVGLLFVTALRCSLHLTVKVQGDVAEFLLETGFKNNMATGTEMKTRNCAILEECFRDFSSHMFPLLCSN